MTARGWLRPARAASALLLALIACGRAHAQSAPGARAVALGVSAIGALPVSLGSTAATLTRPDGGTLVVYRVHDRLAPGLGVEVRLGVRVASRLAIQAAGAWTAVNAESRLSGDVEDATSTTASVRVSRFTAEGAALVPLVEGPHAMLFLRGGGGWLREVTRGVAIIDDAPFGSGGLGVKYLWRNQSARRVSRVALRLEARAVVRSGRPFLADRTRRILPVVVAGLSLGL